MNYRELLELAAKAAGIDPNYMTETVNGVKGEPFIAGWNPFTDDGDALRLAVKLNLDIRVDTCDGGICVSVFGNYDDTPEPVTEEYEESQSSYAATRRAIVRAAAEIGKAMEG